MPLSVNSDVQQNLLQGIHTGDIASRRIRPHECLQLFNAFFCVIRAVHQHEKRHAVVGALEIIPQQLFKFVELAVLVAATFFRILLRRQTDNARRFPAEVQ